MLPLVTLMVKLRTRAEAVSKKAKQLTSWKKDLDMMECTSRSLVLVLADD
jgi:hypothetical protein